VLINIRKHIFVVVKTNIN